MKKVYLVEVRYGYSDSSNNTKAPVLVVGNKYDAEELAEACNTLAKAGDNKRLAVLDRPYGECSLSKDGDYVEHRRYSVHEVEYLAELPS